MSVAGLDPGVVGDRPVPHLLAALLTPTCAPHASLPKHWEGRIISSALVRHPLLARFSHPFAFFLSPFTFSFSSFAFSPHDFLFSQFSPHAFLFSCFSLLTLFLSSRFSPHAFLFTLFLFRTYLSLVFISPGRLRGVPSAQSSPRPTGARLP